LFLLALHLLPAALEAADLSYRGKEISELIGLINDPEFDVRMKAAEALEVRAAELRSRPADIARLIRQLDYNYNHWNDIVSPAGVEILKTIGKPAAPFLLAELGNGPQKKAGWSGFHTWLVSLYIEIDPDNTVAWAIAFLKTADNRQINVPITSYAKLGKPAVGPLIEIMEDDATSLRTKRNIIAILGQMNDRDEQTTQALQKMLKHPDHVLRNDAQEALNLSFQKLLEEMENPQVPKHGFMPENLRPQLARDAIKRLGQLKDRRAIMPLITKLGAYDEVLVDALRSIGHLPVGPLAAILLQQEDDPTHGTTGFVPGGGQIGDSRLPTTRRKAAILLASTEDQTAAVHYLIRGLQDEDVFVRIEATKSLGRIGSPAIDPLIEALSSDNLWVREGAVKALGAIRYSEGIDALLPLLKDESWYIRYSVGSILAAVGKDNALPNVKHALTQESNPLVRKALEQARQGLRRRSLFQWLTIPPTKSP
jgi:HEAT repeat protein